MHFQLCNYLGSACLALRILSSLQAVRKRGETLHINSELHILFHIFSNNNVQSKFAFEVITKKNCVTARFQLVTSRSLHLLLLLSGFYFNSRKGYYKYKY